MRLTGEEIEQAFVQAAGEQVNGEPFNWERVALLLNAVQLLRVNGEARIIERLGQVAGVVRHEAEREPFLPRRQQGRGEHLAGAGYRRRLGDDH